MPGCSRDFSSFCSVLRLTHLSPFQKKPRLHVCSRFSFFTSTHLVPSAFGISGRSQTIFGTHFPSTSVEPCGQTHMPAAVTTIGGTHSHFPSTSVAPCGQTQVPATGPGNDGGG